jgi:hypothetical protein
MILFIIEGHLITLHKYFNPLSHPSTLVIVPHTWVEDITILESKKGKKGFNGVQEVQCELMPSWLVPLYSIESFPKFYQVMMNQFDNKYHGFIKHRIWKPTYY